MGIAGGEDRWNIMGQFELARSHWLILLILLCFREFGQGHFEPA